jgi:hypothetical protein
VTVAYAAPGVRGLQLHHLLRELNERRMTPLHDDRGWREDLASETAARVAEHEFVETARAEVAERAAAAPDTPDGFLAWFERLRNDGPGQGDRLFPWIENHATIDQLKWFLSQEVAGEAGFDDLVALTQLKMPVQAKLELARNYWDEMGRGMENAMHGPMLSRLATSLELDLSVEIVVEALALGNLLCALAHNRRYAYHSVGALGAIELTAPERSRMTNLGLKRLRVPGGDRRYYALHATVDIEHSIAWNREIIGPLVAENPACATAIAEGALMRLTAGERCFIRYRNELGLA